MPLSEDGEGCDDRTQAMPLMPRPRCHNPSGAKLIIELSPTAVAPVNTDVNVPVINSQILTVGDMSNFHIQLMSEKSVEELEQLSMSYILMTNGRITHTGKFCIKRTKEYQTQPVDSNRLEKKTSTTCIFQGALLIPMTPDMVPYSTLIVYTFQPTFGFCVAEPYRFSVAGLFQSSLTLNATVVPFTPVETMIDNCQFMEEWDLKSIRLPVKVQDQTRVELLFTGTPESTVGLNVVEYDSVLQGLSNDMTKERLLKYLTSYERVPFVSMPTMPVHPRSDKMIMEERDRKRHPDMTRRTISEKDEEKLMNRERMVINKLNFIFYFN